MGALITLPPSLIDTGATESGYLGSIDSEYAGPYFFNGVWYAILAARVTGAATNLINVYSSIDRITWTAQDPTHAPPNANHAIASYVPFFDSVNGIIYLVYQTQAAPTTLVFSSFSLTTLLWTNGIFPTVTSVSGDPAYAFVARADGSAVLVYMNSAQGAAYSINTAGTWSAAAQLTPTNAASTTPNNLILDPVTQTCHAIYWVPGVAQPASNQIWNWVTIASAAGGNALGVPAQIATGINVQGGDVMFRGLIWRNSLVLPLVRTTTAPTATRITAFIGTPLSAPVWSVVDIQVRTNASGAGFLYANLFVDAAGVLYFIAGLNGTTAQLPVQILLSRNAGGGFSIPSLFYDASLNPPSGPLNPLDALSEVAIGISPAGAVTGFAGFLVAAGGAAFALRGALGPSGGVNIVLGLKGMKVYPVSS